MPISANRFDRLPDPNQTEAEALAYRVVRLLQDNPHEAFRAEEITAKLLGRKTKGFDLKVSLEVFSVEEALELLVKQGHVQKRTADDPFNLEYYRLRRS